MNLRRLAQSLAAAILTVGVLATGATAPASAAPSHTVNSTDTGWGII